MVITDIIIDCEMSVDIKIFCPEKMDALLHAALLKTGKRIADPVQVTVVVMNDQAIRKYNAQYRQKDAPTNVLAFPTAEKNEPWLTLPNQPMVLGDIFISLDRVIQEAQQQSKDPIHHAMHLLLHGFLHLLHYDHMHEDEAKEMEDLECSIFHDAGWPNPYLENDTLRWE
jgi:probable rRNA maturation factor